MKFRIGLSLILLTAFSGCYKDHLYVQQEWIDRNFLASTHVQTPDPRQECPPTGQRLLISWRFPRNLYWQKLTLKLTVRFWDQQEEEIFHPIDHAWGWAAFPFFDRRILTYLVEVIDAQGCVVEVWEHQFWVKLIDRSNSSVSFHPKQGSVMETP